MDKLLAAKSACAEIGKVSFAPNMRRVFHTFVILVTRKFLQTFV